MPLVLTSEYEKPWHFFNAHIETIFPSVFSKQYAVNYERKKLELSDGDFLDLDWIRGGNRKLLIISHGLEGSTERHYVKRAADYFQNKQWDILAWNTRGCGGETNRLARSSHHGETHDLAAIVDHALTHSEYESIVLLGISMGGCQTVKYFGEFETDDRILGGFTASVSCQLRDTSIAAEGNLGGFYAKVFLNSLKKNLKLKAKQHKEISEIDIDEIKSFDDFHRDVTLKIYGFDSVEDFYKQSSCGNYFEGITKPVFILNAQNDPLLGSGCFPYDEIGEHQYVYLETPKHGGHVGFELQGKPHSYIEVCAENFINEILKLNN